MIAIIGFVILGIIINCGGVPTQTTGYIGGLYWSGGEYPAFRNGFKGFCSVFVNAAFAFAGTELCGLAAAESENPSKAVPKASKQVFWRIALFYVSSLTIIGLIVPANSDYLLGASGGNTKASPFVLAISGAGIYALPSIFNAVITLSVLSVANSSTYGSTRTIQALAMKGMAPKIFAKVDKHGRPIWSLILALLFGCLAYINCDETVGDDVFNWLLAISALATLFTWGSINLNHIRFRYAWKRAGHSLDELPWHSPYGTWGSWIGLLINIIALIAQFYIALFVSLDILLHSRYTRLIPWPGRFRRSAIGRELLRSLPCPTNCHCMLCRLQDLRICSNPSFPALQLYSKYAFGNWKETSYSRADGGQVCLG